MWPHIITSSSETFHEYGKRKEEEYSLHFLFDKLATKVLGYLILSTKCPDQNLKHAGKEGLLARMGKTSLVLDILHELFVHQPN